VLSKRIPNPLAEAVPHARMQHALASCSLCPLRPTPAILQQEWSQAIPVSGRSNPSNMRADGIMCSGKNSSVVSAGGCFDLGWAV
jgi:hypothetical protein